MSGNGARTGMTGAIMKTVPRKTLKDRLTAQLVFYAAAAGGANQYTFARSTVMILIQTAKNSPPQASVSRETRSEVKLVIGYWTLVIGHSDIVI